MSKSTDQAKPYLATEEILYDSDMKNAPQGVKLICENPGGVAIFASVNAKNMDHFLGWAPMPKKRTQRNIISSIELKIEQVKAMLTELGANELDVMYATETLKVQLESVRKRVNYETSKALHIDDLSDHHAKKKSLSAEAVAM